MTDRTVEAPGERARLIAALEGLETYISYHGALHNDGCPEDDTCSCAWKPVNDGVNDAVRLLVALTPPPSPEICAAYERETGAECELPSGHTENHRGKFRHGVAQWPHDEKKADPPRVDGDTQLHEPRTAASHEDWQPIETAPLDGSLIDVWLGKADADEVYPLGDTGFIGVTHGDGRIEPPSCPWCRMTPARGHDEDCTFPKIQRALTVAEQLLVALTPPPSQGRLDSMSNYVPLPPKIDLPMEPDREPAAQRAERETQATEAIQRFAKADPAISAISFPDDPPVGGRVENREENPEARSLIRRIPVELTGEEAKQFHDPSLERLPEWLESLAAGMDRHEATEALFMQEICGLQGWAQIVRLLLQTPDTRLSPLAREERSADADRLRPDGEHRQKPSIANRALLVENLRRMAADDTTALSVFDRFTINEAARRLEPSSSSDQEGIATLIAKALKLAKEATNGWACYASRDKERDEIGRLHREIDQLKAALLPPVRQPEGPK